MTASDARPPSEDHEPCCGCCKGAGSDASCGGPCWDCRGTGHDHVLASDVRSYSDRCPECGHLNTHAGYCTQVGREIREQEERERETPSP